MVMTLAELLEPADWMDGAVCRQVDPDLWFPEKGGSSTEAKTVCGGCVVRAECLAYALEHRENHGVWGGKSPKERHAILGRAPAYRAAS